MVELAPLNVNPVVMLVEKQAPVPLVLIVEVPKIMLLVTLPFELKMVQLRVLLRVLNVPLSTVNVLLETKVSASCTVPPGEFTVIGWVNVFPALVIDCVFLPANVMLFVPDNVVPEPLIQLP